MKTYTKGTVQLIKIFFLALLVSCQKTEPPTEAELASVENIAATENIKVETKVVKEKVFEYFIETKGKVEAEKQVDLFFETQGKLEKIYVQNGDFVKKGELIAELNRTQLELALEKARLELQVRQGDYQLKLDEYALYNGDTTSMNAQQRLNMLASSGLGIAHINYQEAKYQVENAVLKAPFPGRIANLFANEGSLTNSEAFCKLYSSNELTVKAQVLETDINQLKIGQKATLRLIGNTTAQYEASLSRINPLVGENGQVSLLLTVKQPQGLILGMNVAVTLRIPRAKALAVPKEALVIRSGKSVVFTHEAGKAKWNYVTTGLENGKEIEIIEGLAPNSQVITTNNLQLEHDTPVEIN